MALVGVAVPAQDRRRILCVDPDDTTASAFSGGAFEAVAATTVEEAAQVLEGTPVDCVVSEYDLPDGDVFDLFARARAHHPNVGCLLYTATGHDEMDLSAVDDVVAEYLPKTSPESEQRLRDVVARVVDDRSQVGFPLPPDEDDRLAVLAAYDIPGLDTVEAFDRLSGLVAEHFDVDVAFVGLLGEDTEEFLACHGADWEQLSREDSICTYSILDESVTVVEDVQSDPRLEHNDRLRELDIRSYAGANITVDGTAIGELCLAHDEPRSYTDDELTALGLFADEVAEQLEFRRRLQQTDPEAPSPRGGDR